MAGLKPELSPPSGPIEASLGVSRLRFLVGKPSGLLDLARTASSVLVIEWKWVENGFHTLAIFIDLYDGCSLWHENHQNPTFYSHEDRWSRRWGYIKASNAGDLAGVGERPLAVPFPRISTLARVMNNLKTETFDWWMDSGKAAR